MSILILLSVISVAVIAGMCARDLHGRSTRLQRLLNDHHQAESDRLWAEFDTTQPMPGTGMEGRWP